MAAPTDLTQRFEGDRPHLRAVAYRMLGSFDDAEDAVQRTWLKASGSDLHGVQNLSAWLTTVVSRECLDQLRSRRRHPDTELSDETLAAVPDTTTPGPEREAELADSVGRAMLVILDRLSPRERVALVLHDMFAVPFDQIAHIVDASTDNAKKLASRARTKVHGDVAPTASRAREGELAAAFLAAARDGDLPGLVAVLAPDVTRRAEATLLPPGTATEIHGVDEVAAEITVLGRRAAHAEVARVDGRAGLVVAPDGRLQLALVFDYAGGSIAGFEVIADPVRLAQLPITLP